MAVSKQVKNAAAKAAKKGPGLGIGNAAFDLGGNVLANMLAGDNFGSAVAKGIPESMLWGAAPVAMGAYTFAQIGVAAVTGYSNLEKKMKSKYKDSHKVGTNFTYKDTRQALTMRQAAVQAIQGSKMNARNALGGEAALMHRGYTDRRGV